MLLQGFVLLFVLLGEANCLSVRITDSNRSILKRIDANSGEWCYNDPGNKIRLECHVDDTIHINNVEPVWTAKKGSISSADITTEYDRNPISVYTFLTGQNTASVLECACESHILQCFSPVTITIKACTDSVTTSSSSTSSTQPTTTPPPTDSPTDPTQPSGHTQSSTTKKPNKFKGVNPLIYTVIAVFLLGTLAVVAIVTCWIRARKTFYRRHRLPQFTTPRDYFDGISDSDFTPLTANQFYASLRDAPPTYHESEVIQANLREDQTNRDPSHDQSPPPLPPRNHNSSSLRNTSTSDGGDSIQQNEQHTLSPARQIDDETLLVPSTAVPASTTSLSSDDLLL